MKERKNYISEMKGFTLIELAIVLVIIGIIIGAVLKGQDLIENARYKKFSNNIKQFETFSWSFLDRKGYLPGDSGKTGKISGDVNTDLTVNGRFQDIPTTNSFAIGSFNFTVYFGNDGTKNVMILCKSAACAAYTSDELAYVEAFDATIDGSTDGTGGRVKATVTVPTLTSSSSWLTTYASAPAFTSFSTSTQAVLYYFDRK